MAHEIKIEEVENGLKITDTLDGNIVIKYLTTYALPFIRSTNEAGLTFQVVDTVGEIYNLPAEPDEFILYDITGTMYLSSDGTELIENSLNLKPFRRENPYDKVLSLGVVTATEDTVNLPLPVSGINSVRIDGNIYSRSVPQTFAFTEVTTGQKILIIQAKPDSTVFYLVEGAEATEAVEPTFTGLFVARIIVDIDGYVVEYPEYGVVTEDSETVILTGDGTADDKLKATSIATLEQARLNGNVLEGSIVVPSNIPYILSESNDFKYEQLVYLDDGEVSFNYKNKNTGFISNIQSTFNSLGGVSRLQVYNFSGDSTALGVYNNHAEIFSTDPTSKGLLGASEFNKQGDRNAFAQLSDIYDANSYSTDEIKTGGTWIDGKPIYRKVIPFNQDVDELATTVIGLVFEDLALLDIENLRSNINVNFYDSIIDENLIVNSSYDLMNLNYFSQVQNFYDINRQKYKLEVTLGSDFNGNMKGSIILEYTKSTDVAP